MRNPSAPIAMLALSFAGFAFSAIEEKVPVSGKPTGPVELTFLQVDPKSGLKEFRNEIDGTILVYIPGATFIMGCEESGREDESPAHEVTLSPYYMAKYPTTWAQWYSYQDQHGLRGGPLVEDWNKDDHPLCKLTWQEAVDYCEWAGMRLPTEAEYEYAARAGRKGLVWGTRDGTITREQANYLDTGGPDIYVKTGPVGVFPPNPFGLYDLCGNMGYWCQDWYDAGFYAKSPARDPIGPETGEVRVVRGGSWCNNENRQSASYRDFDPAWNRCHSVGLRPAMGGDSQR